MSIRMGRAPRHITGKHGQRPPREPYKSELGKGGPWARWNQRHPITGQTTPPRPSAKRRERLAAAAKLRKLLGIPEVKG